MANNRRVALVIAQIAVMILSPVILIAQGTSTSDWSSLRNVTAGTKISVKLKTDRTVEGNFKSVSDSSLTMITKNAPLEIKREDIASVYEAIKKSAMKPTLIGLGIGAGAGAGIGAAASASDNDGFEKLDHAVTAGLAVAGAVAGAVGGYLVGRGARKQILIFENK